MNRFKTTAEVSRDPRVARQGHDVPSPHHGVPTMLPFSRMNEKYQSHTPPHLHPYSGPQPQPQQPFGYIPVQAYPFGRGEVQQQPWAHHWDQRRQGNTHAIPHGGVPQEHLRFVPHQTEHRIVQIGEGTTVAGQSTEYFPEEPRASLCYQCCKRHAVDPCKKFQTFLDWWMDKIDLSVDISIERRARDRVLEIRAEIPDVAAPALDKEGMQR
ncbi:hypothetical protein ONZ43_g5930 [Nemania bipapillata]|uniref:Uncharacterized protein n=1 Tax=Nemania bipapillata TaxID=110536 RepID=A0ACC2I4D6_9PEZI|nr:hypothetical protein ONZ43_g5930 [Nemania bipapillata]